MPIIVSSDDDDDYELLSSSVSLFVSVYISMEKLTLFAQNLSKRASKTRVAIAKSYCTNENKSNLFYHAASHVMEQQFSYITTGTAAY